MSKNKKIIIGLTVCFISCFCMLFTGVDTASASVSYDSETNTIYLEDGTNTLASICSEIGDPSVLDYNSETNTYTLSADISGKEGVDADLVLEDSTLIIHSTATNRYLIKTWSDMIIENMTIKTENPSYPWMIWVYAHRTAYSLKVTDSDISGGHILAKPNGYVVPSISTVVTNNYFHDTTLVKTDVSYFDCVLGLFYGAATNAFIYNNTFENIHITGTINPGPGILWLHEYGGCVVDKIYISNCSVSSYGMIRFYGSGALPACQITNFEIKDCVGAALMGKEYSNVLYSNGTIKNVTTSGVFFYQSYSVPNFWVWNVSIDGADKGIKNNAHSGINVDIYNVKINDVDVAYDTGYNSEGTFYITNSIATNYNTLYSIPCPDSPTMEIREYQLSDIYITDTNSNPIENATVTIEPTNCDVSDCSINRKLEILTTTETLSNGHTPLPNEDETNTVVLLRLRKTSTTEKSDYSYTITASKDGHTNSTTITPDETWYRSDPNTYQNTVTIVLDMGTEDTTPPYTSSHSPAKDSINVSKDTDIILHIQDDNSGVDQSSIQMKVEGEIVSPTITGTSSNYTLTYNPLTDFEYNQVVDVIIDASDLASTPNAMNTETYSFTIQSSPDQTPPTGLILINSGDSQTNSQTANLTISATDPSDVTEMKISETNNFSSATAEPYSTIKSFILSIGDGIKTIYIWFKDTIGNWNTQPYSDSITLDTTGPIISNIQETNITTNSVTITFQTNENSTSQIEYGLTLSYGSSTTKNETLKTSHSVNLSNLSDNTTYHYRIISEDNLSNSSNSTDQTFKTNQSSIPDTTSPSAITDLESDNITQTSADLEWTSPGDDNNEGTASAYDIRYSLSNITESNWNSAIQISGEPIPQSAGTEQSVYIAVGLSPNTTYYFAIKTSDEVPNTSNISNILSFITLEESVSPPGGGGGGGTISDTTPPSKPSNFTATGADKQITLKWNNPTESDFVRILLIKKEDSFPLSKDDGTVLYEGTNEEYTDIELNNNTTYYYSIFAYDKKPNYSEALSISSKPIEGKTSISNGNGKQTYPEGTLLKIPESFKIYIIINQKKKWIPTPEVFETLGYEWTSITEINKTELSNIPNYEDNLIRAIQDYKVYLVVNGIKRHIPNPEIFLNYGFEWDDVKDVEQSIIDKYSQNLLIKESKQQKVYYLCPERKIRRWLRSPEIFNSYDNKWEDIQVISKYEMEHYMESNLIKLIGDNKVYLVENNTKQWIKSSEEFERLGLDWEMVMEVGEVEVGW